MDLVYRILTLIGSLGLFLYGMKLLSESLQRVTGTRTRPFMSRTTSTRLRRVFSGIAVTSIVQSSSAVTVMIVSFVNAGLVNLRQAIGLIMGANIGASFTIWLICIFGFSLEVGYVALPLASIGFLLIVFSKGQYKSVGYLVMGMSILFLGLYIIKTVFSDPAYDNCIADFFGQYANMGFPSLLIFFFLGVALTAVMQSSTATIILTMVLSVNGWLPFETAAAMVLGENVGTTLTANLAATVTNTDARRAALSHVVINVIGVLWMFPLLPLAVTAIKLFFQSLFGLSLEDNANAIIYEIALFNTLFNVVNVIILLYFVPQIIRIVTKMIPGRYNFREDSHLQALEYGMVTTSEFSTVQADYAIFNLARNNLKMFTKVRELFGETDSQQFEKIGVEIEICDRICYDSQREIMLYLSKISLRELSDPTIRRMQIMFRIISHIEMIQNGSMALTRTIKRRRKANLWFTDELRSNVMGMFDLLEQALLFMLTNLERPTAANLEKSMDIEMEINIRTSILWKGQVHLKERDYKYSQAIIFTELIGESEKLGDAIVSVSNEMRRMPGGLTPLPVPR